MRSRARSTKPAIDAHSDAVLIRHIRLLKPELAKTGFRTARWGEVAAATNKELVEKKFKTGRAAQRRFAILRDAYDDDEQREHLPARLMRRMDDYFEMLRARLVSAAGVEGSMANRQAEESDDGENDDQEVHEGVDTHETDYGPGDRLKEEDDEGDEGVEEIEFKREAHVGTVVDLSGDADDRFAAPSGFAFALPRSREAILYEQVQGQQKMMQSLLKVIRDDRAALSRLATRK